MGRPRKLTAEQEAEVWNQYQSGTKVAAIAREMQLPYMLVYLSIKREKDYNKQTLEDSPTKEL